MSKNLVALINDIHNLTVIEDLNNTNQIIFNLGCIRGLCAEYLVLGDEEKDNTPVKMVSEEVSETPAEHCTDDLPFGVKAAEILAQSGLDTDMTSKAIDLLERRASHMNLKFEISKRWSPSAAKLIRQMLNRKGIVTMMDFVTIFDDPVNFNTIEFTQSASSANREKLNKVFPLKHLGENDNKKFFDLYLVANDNGKESSSDIFAKFVTDPNTSQTGKTRYINALNRSSIYTVNQLYFFLSKYGMKEITKLNGVGHISEPIIELYSTIKENK